MPGAQEILTACNQAIIEIISGAAQEKTIDLGGGKTTSYSALDLDKLRRFRDALKVEVQSDRVGGPFVSAQFLPSGNFS